MMAVTAVSAKESTANSGNAVKAPPVINYIVVPWTEKSLSNEKSSSTEDLVSSTASTTYTIRQGQTRNHYAGIPSGMSWLEVDLNWGTPSNSLTLTIINPSGTSLGTLHDNFDGSVNGRIHLGIYPSSGNIGTGVWTYRVYGETVSGTQSYTINSYGHQA